MPELLVPSETLSFRVLRHLLWFVAASLLLLGIAGCGAALDTQSPQIRVVHASLHAGTVDVLSLRSAQETSAVAYRLSVGAVTTYFPATALTYAFASSESKQVETRASLHASAAGRSTIVVRDTAGGVAAQVLPDQDRPAPAGRVLLRVLQDLQNSVAADLYLVPLDRANSRTVLLQAAGDANTNNGYASVPSGVYMLYVMASGVPLHNSIPLYSGPAVSYPSGTARTLIVLPSGERQSAWSVLTLKDYEPAETAQ